MEEQKLLLTEQIQKIREELNNLKPGSEEHKRLNDELVGLAAQYTSMLVAETNAKEQVERRKHNKRFLYITAGGTIIIPAAAILLQFVINKDIIRIEEFGSIAGHAAFGKNLLSIGKMFGRNVVV